MADTNLKYELLPYRNQARLRIDSVDRTSRRQLSDTGSRARQRKQRDPRPFATYDCSCIALDEDEKQELTRFWEAHLFDTNDPVSDSDAFLFLDDTHAREYKVEDEQFATGDGSQTVFQLDQTLSYGDRNYERPIRHIKENSETITNGGTETTAYDLNYNTGEIDFDNAPSNNNALKIKTLRYYKKVVFLNDTWSESLNGTKWDVSFSLQEVL